MANEPRVREEIDRRRVRIGLALLVIVVVGSLAAAVVIENPTGRAVMVLIAVFTVGRAYVFTRSIRRDRGLPR